MQIPITDAKNRFSEVIRRSEAGDSFVVTNDGKPAALLTGTPRPRDLPPFGAPKGRIRIADDFGVSPEGLPSVR